jgi:hypothetical protein
VSEHTSVLIAELTSPVSLIMRYPHQCCLWWGKDLTLIYNSPYAENMHKHPDLFGSSGPVAWQGE